MLEKFAELLHTDMCNIMQRRHDDDDDDDEERTTNYYYAQTTPTCYCTIAAQLTTR